MFSPLSALSATGRGAEEGYTDPKLMNQIGLQALGRALLPPGGNAEQGPQPPPPGQASMPSQPQQSPMPAQAPTPPGAGGQPPMQPVAQQAPQPGPAQPVAMPPQQMGSQPGNGLDLRSLMARIAQANPGIPPQAMVAALTHATPILNADAQRQLLDIRRSIYGLGSDMRNRQMDLRSRQLDLREQGMNTPKGKTGGARAEMPPEAVQALQEGHVTTFGNGQQWTLQNGQPMQVGGPQDGTLHGQPDEPMDSHGPVERMAGPVPDVPGMTDDKITPQGAKRLRLHLRLPETIDEFKRHFGRDPTTDSEVEAYSDQMGQGGPVPGVNDKPAGRYRGEEIPQAEFNRRANPNNPDAGNPYRPGGEAFEKEMSRAGPDLHSAFQDFQRQNGRPPTEKEQLDLIDKYYDNRGHKFRVLPSPPSRDLPYTPEEPVRQPGMGPKNRQTTQPKRERFQYLND